MIKLKKIKPLFTKLVTTADKYDSDTQINGVVVPRKGTIKEIQEVVAVGTCVRDMQVGDKVQINLTRFLRMKHHHKQGDLIQDNVEKDCPTIECEAPVIELNGKPCFLIEDRDIDFVVEDYVDEKESTIKVVKNRIITL